MSDKKIEKKQHQDVEIEESEKQPKEKDKEKEETIIKYGFIALVAILAISLIAYLLITLIPTYVITIGNEKITEDEFTYYYLQEQAILLQYKDSAAPQMSDQQFLSAKYSENLTFHDLAKHRAINRLQEVYILYDMAQNNPNFRHDPQELADSKATFERNFVQYAENQGMNKDQMAKDLYGVDFKTLLYNHELAWFSQKYESHLFDEIEPEVTQEEVKTYYTENQESFNRATVRHLLITTFDPNTGQPYNEEGRAQAQARATQLYEQVLEGADFEELIMAHSEDPGALENKGVYSFRINDAFLTDFVNWAFTHDKGEMGLIETETGFHIIEQMGMTEFEDVQAEVKETLIYSKIMQRVDREKSSDEFAVRYYNAFEQY